jgi:hypothetical protein
MVALERFVDMVGLDNVIAALREICYEKADHVQTNWQDKKLAAVWNRRGNRLDTVLGKLV